MPEQKYQFDGRKAKLEEAERRIQYAYDTGAKQLDLDRDLHLTELPESISKLDKLEHLKVVVHSNLFKYGESEEGESLPEFVCRLKELRSLHLEWYGLNELPEAISELKHLSSLRIAFSNRHIVLPNSIGQLAQLEELQLLAGRTNVLPDSIGNLRKLAPNLSLLEREGLLEVWCDLQITPGDIWDDKIKRKLEQAQLYLFLMSTDLLVSDYVQKTEFPIALGRYGKGMARIIPVIVSRCSWKNYLGLIQGLPEGGRPIKEWPDKDQAFHNVELGLRLAISEMRALSGRS